MPTMRNDSGKLTLPGWISGVAVALGIIGGLWGMVSVVRSADTKAVDLQFEVHHDTLVSHAQRIDTLEGDVDTLKRDVIEIRKDQQQALNLTLLIAQQIGVSPVKIEAAMLSPDSADTIVRHP